MNYKTIILSDLHLGSKSCRDTDILDFLKNNTCDRLILNGDIIDGWALKRGGRWKDNHTKIVRKIMKMSEKGTKVIWIRGNHDEFIKDFIPLTMSNIEIREDYKFISQSGKIIYCFHGDAIDVFMKEFKWIALVGSIGYDMALWLNRVYNKVRNWLGLPYYSISRDIKNGVKRATNFINDFENTAVKLGKQHQSDITVCGHIHQPKIDTDYMNSGDWCENCTGLVETFEGEWRIYDHHSPSNEPINESEQQFLFSDTDPNYN